MEFGVDRLGVTVEFGVDGLGVTVEFDVEELGVTVEFDEDLAAANVVVAKASVIETTPLH